jgi:voltage-dependent potassium channel beta subunit
MKYRKVGKFGISLSEVSLGSWLTYGSSYGDDLTKICVKKAFDLGINHFDTADQYGYDQTHAGAAEEALGEALKGYARNSYVVATKTFWPVGEGINDKGLSRKHIFEQCNASLKRLNVDYIDIFYCHRFDPTTPLEETLMALNDLIQQGKILYIGVSEWSPVQIMQAKVITERYGLNPIVIDQPLYNMLHRNIEEEIMPLCEAEGIGVAVWSPIAQGVLTGKYSKGGKYPQGSRATDASAMNGMIEGYLSDANLDKVEKLKPIAADLSISLGNLALAWALNHKQITSVITGASKPEQIEENVKAVNVTIDSATMQTIDEILK